MTSRLRTLLFSFLVYAAFFLSGAGCLTAEVTWNRMLIVVVGNSLTATAMIIMVFMGGLGLGSWLGGRYFARRRPSLLPYVTLEMAVAVYVLLSPWLLGLLDDVFFGLAMSGSSPSALGLVRVLITMGALLLPAMIMGATFPAMVAGAAPRGAVAMSARTGYLYSFNTIGAAIGTFAAGYHLLLEFGVDVTVQVAFGVYLLASLLALLAWALARGVRAAEAAADPGDAPEPAPAEDDVTPAGAPRRRFLLAATFAVGFVALAYEVLLTRLGILHLGNAVSVFSLVLTGFLLGTGISAVAGTWVYGLAHRGGGERAADRVYGVVAVLAGVFVMLTPYLLLTDWLLGPLQYARVADDTPHNPLPIVGVIILPTMLLGALLPLAIRMLQPAGHGAGTRQAASLYAVNTAGGVLGAALANHVLVPAIGMQATLALLAGLCVAAGAIHLLSLTPRRAGWLPGAGVAVAATLLMALALPDMMTLYAQKIADTTGAVRTEVKLLVEGRAATVTVLDQDDEARGYYRDMYLNGVEEASTRYWHVQLFKLLGVLPGLVHESDEPKDALVIAFGAGITAGSVLAAEDVRSLDVVDLNPDIEGINDLFTDVNGDVFHQPRFTFHNDDGRNFLLTCGRTYDLIINDSTHPRAYDSWILYTEEFYEAVRLRLAPGGVFAQWVPVLGSMQGELMRIHLNTFRTVFPNSTLWYVYGSDQAFLMATPEPFGVDAARLQERLDALAPWFRGQDFEIATVADVAGFFWLDDQGFTDMIAGETRRNTDHVHYFDKQSAVWPLPPQWRLPRFQASMAPYVDGADAAMTAAMGTKQAVALALGRYSFYGSRPDLHRAWCAAPENHNVRFFMGVEYGGHLPDHDAFCMDEAERTYRDFIRRDPRNARALNALADLLITRGEYGEAEELAGRAVALDPDNGMILDTHGWALVKLGRVEEAVPVLQRADRHLPDHPIVNYHLGAAWHEAGRHGKARARLEKAVQLADDFPGVEDARRRLETLD